MASSRSSARAAAAPALKERKEAEGIAAQGAAVAEAARIREMFAEDRRRLEKRYGVVKVSPNPDAE